MTVQRPDMGPQGPNLTPEQRDLIIWLDGRLEQIDTNHLEAHARLRRDMEKGFNDVFAQARSISAETRINADGLLVMKTQRDMERQQGIRVGVIYGAMAGAATSAIVGALMRVLTGP